MLQFWVSLLLMFGLLAMLFAIVAAFYRRINRWTAPLDSPQAASQRARHQSLGPVSGPGPLTLFDRVMQIRELVAGLPPEHHSRLLKRLYQDLAERGALGEIDLERLVQALEQTRLADPKATAFPQREIPPAPPTLAAIPPAANSPVTPASAANLVPAVPATVAPAAVVPAAVVPAAVVPATVVPAAVVHDAVVHDAVVHDASAKPVLRTPAPWDMPEPPPRAPRKTLAEWSQGFMEAKNIHWGELASGILIVGSAMGLVLSLRRELQDTVPYFPALLFLLISLAVHQAGVYTLQRWRLRSTSRGLLLISLLLVPLNFLAGILFNAESDSQRPLNDPWLWTAVGVGSAGLGWITWSAAGCLLRRGRWQLLLPLLTIGLGMILINRWPWAHEHPLRLWAFLPLVLSVVVPWSSLTWILAARPRASGHSATRVWIVAGISLFSLGTAYALFLMKSPDQPQVLSSLAPGSAIWVCSLLGLLSVLTRRLRAESLRPLVWISWVLIGVLGFALAVLLAWAWRCPRDLFLLTILYTAAAGVAAGWTRRYVYLPAALVSLLLAALIGRGLWTGAVTWHEIVAPAVLLDLVLNGRAAVLFLLTGTTVAVATPLIVRTFGSKTLAASTSDPHERPGRWWEATPPRLRRWNFLTAVGLVSCGSLVALIGAYRPAADRWDSLLGSGLLLSVALMVVTAALWGNFRHRSTVALTVVGTLLLLATALEASFGNRYLQTQWGTWGIDPLQRGLAAGTLVTAVLLAASVCQVQRRKALPALTFAETAWFVGHLGLLVGWAAVVTAPYSRLATASGGLLAAATLAAGCLCPRWRQARCESAAGMGLLFLVGTHYQATELQPTQVGTAAWAFVSAAAIGLGCLVAAWLDRRHRGTTSADRRGDDVAQTTPASDRKDKPTQDGNLVSLNGLTKSNSKRRTMAAHGVLDFRPRELALALVPLALLGCVVAGCLDAVNREIWAVAPTRLPAAWQLASVVNLATAVLLGWAGGLLYRSLGSGRAQASPWSLDSAQLGGLAAGLLIVTAVTQGVRWDDDLRAASGIRWSVVTLGLLGAALSFVLPGWLVALPTGGATDTDPTGLADKEEAEKEEADKEEAEQEYANKEVGRVAFPDTLKKPTLGALPAVRQAIVWTWVVGCVAVVFSLTGLAVAGFLLVGPAVAGVSPRSTWLGSLRTDATYGLPVAILLAMVLMLSISQHRRSLAIAGSYLLRSIVVFQLLLLMLSPHPRLATEWFVMIVQMVSAGMTLYGWSWWANRQRCHTPFTVGHWWQPLQMHTLFNAALLVGLMSLVVAKYYLEPTQTLGWIQAAGNTVGLVTVLVFLPLYYVLFLRVDTGRGDTGGGDTGGGDTRSGDIRPGDALRWLAPAVVVAMIAATMTVVNLERWGQWPPGVAFVALGWSWVVIAAGMAVAHGLQPLGQQPHESHPWFRDPQRLTHGGLWAMLSGLILLFSFRGLDTLPPFEVHFRVMLTCLLGIGVTVGAARQATWLPFLLAPLASVVVAGWVQHSPQRLVPRSWETAPSVHLAAYLLIAVAWATAYLLRRNWGYCINHRSPLQFGRWTLLAALALVLIALAREPGHVLPARETVVLGMCIGLTLLNLWCDREHWRISPRAWVSLATVTATSTSLAAWLLPSYRFQGLVWLISAGATVFAWGVCLHYARSFEWLGRRLRVPRLAATRQAAWQWLPRLAATVAVALLVLVLGYQFNAATLWERQIATFGPLLAGLGFVAFAMATQQAWQRYTAITLFTITALFLSWTTVPSGDAWGSGVLFHTYWVLGFGYLVYGFVIAHALRAADAWREALQKSSLILLVLAVGCLSAILLIEFDRWVDVQPQSATTAQAALVALMTLGLAVSLIVVALRPQQQVVTLDMQGRQGLVYAAQLLLVATVAHCAFTLPGLFRFGLQQYWPYVAMGLAFGGIGVWHWLQRRGLIVLAEPLATTLLLLPAAAACVSLGWPAQTDRSLVLLLAGLVYGCLTLTHPGFWTRLATFASGNMALWLLLDRFPLLSFQNHPQLWLIPPAVATLAVSWIEAPRLGTRAATSLRYLALAAIYISSTSELFIHGIGQSLAPPMILATLAVLGMLVGMLLNIREYIVLGVLFLLVAMFTMVSHAQQQLGHVWPWWAFGITLGVATLVFFGIFEQRRNQKRQLLTANQDKNANANTDPTDSGR